MRQGEAMMPKNWQSRHPKRCNGHHRDGPVEPLSARIVRLRIARGYSVYELARAGGGFHEGRVLGILDELLQIGVAGIVHPLFFAARRRKLVGFPHVNYISARRAPD